tara:strand:- start:2663 stop:3094 length:432 start_codon:yes stop_codon:yes gene_type:complete
MVAGAAIGAMGAIQEGNAAEAAGKFTARQQQRNAKNSMAEGIRKATEIQRMGDRAQSDASAAMAAGGGVTDDVGAIKTLSDIQAVTDYNALSAIYEGDLKADTQNMQADMDRMAGKQAQQASRFKAASTVLSAGSKAYSMGAT